MENNKATCIPNSEQNSDCTNSSNVCNSEMRPRLTIAIPTYNRSNYLKRCLDSVLQQNRDLLEILVSNNASTDETGIMMGDYCARYPFIRYFENASNIGLDRNFLNCLEKSTGEYILLLSDDDVLMPDAVQKIFDALDCNPSFMSLNSCAITKEDPIRFSRPRLKEEGVLEFDDINDFMLEIGIYITYVSSLVFKKDLVDSVSNKESYIGSYFLQSFVALDTLAEKGKYIIVTHCCIGTTPNHSVSYDLYEVWGRQYSKLIREKAVMCGIDKTIAERIVADSFDTHVLYFVASIRPGKATWNRQAMLDSLDNTPSARRFCRILMILPKQIAVPLALAKMAMARIKRDISTLMHPSNEQS